jgi:hypothetical protein
MDTTGGQGCSTNNIIPTDKLIVAPHISFITRQC